MEGSPGFGWSGQRAARPEGSVAVWPPSEPSLPSCRAAGCGLLGAVKWGGGGNGGHLPGSLQGVAINPAPAPAPELRLILLGRKTRSLCPRRFRP